MLCALARIVRDETRIALKPHYVRWRTVKSGRGQFNRDYCQAEYVLVPNATANLAPIPDGLSDEQVLMCPDIMSTGFGGAERTDIRIGDTVAIFAQGPIGLCATVC